jgi:hypothetical protein
MADVVGGHDLRSARCEHPSVGEEEECVGEAQGEVQVVHHRDDRHEFLGGHPLDGLEHLELVAQVKTARRLVEQQDAWLLRERTGDRRLLQLAAGELVEIAEGEILELEP